MHCHGAQGICGPDGIIYDWYDEPVGRRHDRYFLRDSQVNDIMCQLQLNLLRQYCVYLDKGYDWHTHCRCAAHGALTIDQKIDNWVMAEVRICIEWCFGLLKARNSFILRPQLLKLQLMDVSKIVRVAVLLTNAYTCLQGSETQHYFHCAPPSIEEYFN